VRERQKEICGFRIFLTPSFFSNSAAIVVVIVDVDLVVVDVEVSAAWL